MPPSKPLPNEDKMPLPKGWVRTWSNSQQRNYYSHYETQHTQWHFPTASEANDPWMAKKRNETNHGKQSKPKKTKLAPNEKITPPLVDKMLEFADTTSVAIIVPFRDLHVEQKRSEHLSKFVPHMIQFLGNLQQERKICDFHIYIVEQSDDRRKFNRGKLLNIGFDQAKKYKNRKTGNKHDVFIFHDVDLLPSQALNSAYSKFPKVPHHIARVWDRYSNNKKYFGGIVSFSKSDYVRINGYPNTFWGWGGEDDELQLRCDALGIQWDYPRLSPTNSGIPPIRDLEDMTLQEKLSFLKSHREWKCMVKWEALEEHDKNWKTNGLADLTYKVLQTSPLDTKDLARSKATKITVDVKLNPNNHWANDKCGVDFQGDWDKKK